MGNLQHIINESFTQYAGAVLQSRALIDVRDCLKPSARQIFYCMETDGFTPNKPFKKTLKSIGSAARLFIHGDSSCEGIIMRASQPFALRYPLVEVDGSFGNLMESGNWAAPRYTSSRLSDMSTLLFADLKKNTIDDWRDNYDDTEKYPSVLPSKGFYNIVNGSMGIAVGLAASVPQFNLREVNKALITLLKNENADFDEIVCMPDFATGAILLNADEVKESLRTGKGAACKLRSVVEFDEKDKCFIVKELPYSVYTNTICKELEEMEQQNDCGIDRHNDLTGLTPLIKIYLKKNANPTKVLKDLYKNTSLQSFYSINMNMLEDGRYPKLFGWREALTAYLTHQKIVYRRAFEYDLAKIDKRLHIIEALLRAIADIDRVVATIKKSATTSQANKALQELLNIDEEQAKAILDIKLSRLAHLEIEKLENEKAELEVEKNRIERILQSQELLNAEIIKDLETVAKKYGDERRTQVMNIETETDEIKEVKDFMVTITTKNNYLVEAVSNLYSNNRRSKGDKINVGKNENAVDSAVGSNKEDFLFFTTAGKVYRANLADKDTKALHSFEELFTLSEGEQVINVSSAKKNRTYVVFITKKGLLKKTALRAFDKCRKSGVVGITLNDDDEIAGVELINDEPIMMMTNDGYTAIRETKTITATGRTAKGSKAMTLKDNYIIGTSRCTQSADEVITLTANGKINRTKIADYTSSPNALRGTKSMTLDADDHIIGFVLRTPDQNEVIITYSRTQNKLKKTEIPQTARGARGVLVAKDKPKYIF